MILKQQCVDKAKGVKLPFYEAGFLSEEESLRFEEHLLECDSCVKDLLTMQPVIRALHVRREELRTLLEQDGLAYDTLRGEILAQHRKRRHLWNLRGTAEQGVEWIRRNFGRPIIFGSLATATVVIALLVIMLNQKPLSPYESILNLRPLQYTEVTLRGTKIQEQSGLFDSAMKAYGRGDFGKAAKLLTQAVKTEPGHGTWWMYLGISRLLNQQPGPAITALQQANGLTQGEDRAHVQWYLTQAYLLDNKPDQAIALLDSLHSIPMYTGRADSLLKNVRSIMNIR